MQKKPVTVTENENSLSWNRKYSAIENTQLLLEASDSSQKAFHEPKQGTAMPLMKKYWKLLHRWIFCSNISKPAMVQQ